MDRDKKELLTVKEKRQKKVSYKHTTAILSLVVSGLLTNTLFKADYFNYTNTLEATVTAILCMVTFTIIIYAICDILVNTSKEA